MTKTLYNNISNLEREAFSFCIYTDNYTNDHPIIIRFDHYEYQYRESNRHKWKTSKTTIKVAWSSRALKINIEDVEIPQAIENEIFDFVRNNIKIVR